MKLEFLDDIRDGGKITGFVTDQIMRLYDFEKNQAKKFRQEIQQTIIEKGQSIDLTKLEFIETINCQLTLRIAYADIGITASDRNEFVCDLSICGYENMISLIEPFCSKASDGYQWLYDIDTPIEFLFSPRGTL